jgi:methionine synthase I (cobalamin-dependent)/5,10-methylenetetrahydrofolate reductase
MNKNNKFLLALLEKKPILSDGAMGTVLHQKGNQIDDCFDYLNLTNPEQVLEVHIDYIHAGSMMIQTNTYGANRYKLAQHGLEEKLIEINKAGVNLAHEAARLSAKDVIIAGDVGPLGVRLAPFGRVQLDEAREAFKEQIQVMVEAGVDVIIIETITDLYEVIEAIKASREVSMDTPVIASMTFTRDDLTLLGDTPERIARGIHEAGAEITGINCSGGPLQILRILKKMKAAVPDAIYSVMPNAGWPEQSEGRIMYPTGPDYFSGYAKPFLQSGARVLGGCCGTTPEHISALASALDGVDTLDQYVDDDPSHPFIEVSEARDEKKSELANKMMAGKFVFAVEMNPPRGLSMNKLMAAAGLLADSGADVINVSDSPRARMRMSPWAVCSLIQKHIGIETVLHFPTRGRNLLRVQGDLLAAHALGIRNVFVMMGDPTSIGEYPNAMDNYDLVPSGLIQLIKQSFNRGTDQFGTEIDQPTSFFVGSALNVNAGNLEKELRSHLKKSKAGSDFVLTQPIFDAEKGIERLHWFREKGNQPNLKILAGILPLSTDRHAIFLHNEVPGISIPEKIIERMQQAGRQSPRVGIEIAVELIEALKPYVQGIYIMPAFNRFDYVSEIIEKVK